MAQQDEPKAPEQPISVAELRTQIKGQWQIPLLAISAFALVGATVFLAGRLTNEKPSPQLTLHKAEAALVAQDYKQADSLCSDFIRDYPQDEHFRRIQEIQGDANVGQAAQAYEGAADLYKKAVAAYRAAGDVKTGQMPSPALLHKLGRAYLAMGEPANAVTCFDQALQNAPADPLAVHLSKIEALRAMPPKPDLDGALAEIKAIGEQLKDLKPEEKAEAAIVESEILNERGEYAKAERKLLALLEAEKGSTSALPKKFLMALAQTQRLAGRPTQALDTLHRVLTEAETPEALLSGVAFGGPALLMTGRIYFEMTNYERALEAFRRVAREYPESDEALAARLWTAQTLLALGELRSAGEAYGEIAPTLRKLRPGQNKGIDLAAARQLLKVQCEMSVLARRYEDAFQFVMIEEALLRNPDRDVLWRRATILKQLAELADAQAASQPATAQGQHDKRLAAETAWKEAADLFIRIAEAFDGQTKKEYPDDLKAAAECLKRAGAYQQAIDVLKRFVKEQPAHRGTPNARLDLARQLCALGRWDEAIGQLQELIEQTAPSNLIAVEGTYLLGAAYVRKGPDCYAQAEESFLRIINNTEVTRIDPDNQWYRQSLLSLGRLLHTQKKYDQALLRLNEFVRRYGQDPDALSAAYLLASSSARLGSAYLKKSQEETSPATKEQLRRVGREKLESAALDFQDLAVRYNRLPKEALTPLREKEYENMLFDLGDCLMELERTDEAEAVYKQIVYRYDSLPQVMPGYVQLAKIYQTERQNEKLDSLLARARWTLEKIPEEAFRRQIGAPSKQYWENWLRVMKGL